VSAKTAIASGEEDRAPLPTAPTSRYQLLESLGEGGMGVVYRALDVTNGRVLALKRMSAGASELEVSTDALQLASARFRREYHTLAELAHPNIVQVYDFGIDESGPFYTMELLEGSDLREAAPMPWQQTCALLREVAAALALLHSRRLLHRDISPRNVFRTRAGAVKLIDFGAMSQMGFERTLVGTPPFIPPEGVARQSLDGRSDIYALGALAYFLLTGRHAYPVRNVSQLRDAWRAQLRLPSVYAADVPESVDALVMRMLSLDPQGRPGTAVELVERFSSLAGLELDEMRDATPVRAYLTAPTLVGRDKALLGVRRRTLRAMRSHGAALLVTGEVGVGRSRFLDACALEAKLAGAVVLRVGRADAGSEFAAARALFEQLPGQLTEAELAGYPGAALARSRGRFVTRASLLPPAPDEAASGIERGVIQAQLFSFMAGLAARRLLAILVDDADAIDEPSLALLAGLSRVVRSHRLVIVSALAKGASTHTLATLRALVEASRKVELAPLDLEQVAELLRSLFGPIPNLRLLADRIYRLSTGLPRLCMELAQHLIERGVIQARAGGFMLRESFSVADLPESFRDALRQRATSLDEHARLLGAALALAGSAQLTMEACVELDPGHEPARVHQAISGLQRVQMVSVEAEGLRLAQGYDDALVAAVTPGQRRAIHARLAALFDGQSAEAVRAAKHHFEAEQDHEAIAALMRYALDDTAIRYWFSENRAVFERGIAACKRLGRPAREEFYLRRTLTRALTFYVEPADREQLLAFANELYDLAGAGFFAEAATLSTDPLKQLEHAVKRAFERYEQAPEQQRVLNPFEALTMLGSYIAGVAAYATFILDIELLWRVPSLMPFAPLSPALVLMEKIVYAVRQIRSDRAHLGLKALVENIVTLESPESANLDKTIREATLAHMLNGVGTYEATLGMSSAWQRAERVEAYPDHRVNARRIRYLIHLYRPNAAHADACRRHIEVLRLQEGPRQFGEGSTLEPELLAFARSDDLLGLSRIKPQIEERAALYAGWLPWLRVAEAQLARMRHSLDRAIELHNAALELVEPGKHLAWTHAAAFQLEVLVSAGRAGEARELGRKWLEIGLQRDLHTTGLIELGLALAEAELGEQDKARARVDARLQELATLDMSGIYAGIYEEGAARVAVACGDAAAFQRHFQRCWEQYGSGAYPPLTARLEKLRTAARRRKLAGTVVEDSPQWSAKRVREELSSARSPEERAARALSVLISATHATGGHLYGISSADIVLLASQTAPPPDSTVERELRDFLAAHSDDEQTLGVDEIAQRRSQGGSSGYIPMLLTSERGETESVAAIAALHIEGERSSYVASEITAAIGDELLTHRDVTGLTLAR
jgi:hypothetical protein